MFIQALKVATRNALRTKGYDIVRTPCLQGFLASRKVDLVVDVGAWQGSFGEFLRKWGYNGKIISLEPTADAFSHLARTAARDPFWQAAKVAAGPVNGRQTINLSKDDGYNSFKTLSEAGKAYDPLTEIVGHEEVDVVTLDHFLTRTLAEAPFLKIDAQGYEREILDGAPDFLKRCVGVQLELPVHHLYDGVWDYIEALAYMRERGFVLAQETPTGTKSDDRQSVAEFDCVFRRA